jgi:formylglycine-generating enzyme required for sulfatase activity
MSSMKVLANCHGNIGDGCNAIGSIGGTSTATSPVGPFAANGYGLYDMAGNWAAQCRNLPVAGSIKKVESREKKRLKDGQKNSTEKSPDAQA